MSLQVGGSFPKQVWAVFEKTKPSVAGVAEDPSHGVRFVIVVEVSRAPRLQFRTTQLALVVLGGEHCATVMPYLFSLIFARNSGSDR